MFFGRRIAYSMLIAILAIVPTWGCSSEPPPTPDEYQQGELKPPSVEIGSDTKKGSDTKDPKAADEETPPADGQ